MTKGDAGACACPRIPAQRYGKRVAQQVVRQVIVFRCWESHWVLVVPLGGADLVLGPLAAWEYQGHLLWQRGQFVSLPEDVGRGMTHVAEVLLCHMPEHCLPDRVATGVYGKGHNVVVAAEGRGEAERAWRARAWCCKWDGKGVEVVCTSHGM